MPSVTSTVPPATSAAESIDERLRRVIECHFDPAGGSRYWLDRQARLGVDARRDVQTIADLACLGETMPADLEGRPLLDFIPRRFHTILARFVVAQTGGTTGGGAWTAYRDDEFDEAFVRPFVVAAQAVGFPRGEPWLYVGPSGPHVIGTAARHLARHTGSADPFRVDFDPRWAKRLPDGSFAQQRYVGHVVEQAMAIIRTQPIGVVFTTPPMLDALGDAMSDEQRARIRGVHYGGMAIHAEPMQRFQVERFPNAVHLSGYGNTLFGCCLELSTAAGRSLDYYPFGVRLHVEVVDDAGRPVGVGGVGRVRVTRLDESMLIIRMVERDEASPVDAPTGAPAGYESPGVRDPHVPETLASRVRVGLY